jgi:hypothetical protein
MHKSEEDYIQFSFGDNDKCIVNFIENKSQYYYVVKKIIESGNKLINNDIYKIVIHGNINFTYNKNVKLYKLLFINTKSIPIQVFKKCVKKCENNYLKNINLSYFYKINENLYELIFMSIHIENEKYIINGKYYHLKF